MATKTKILFVDDERGYRNMFAREMRRENSFAVETAGDGKDALEKLISFPADMVIVDLKMQQMSGLELLERIRAQWPNMLAMVVTGSINVDDAIQAMKLGVYDYILKPFETEIFKQAIKNAAKHLYLRRGFRTVHKKVNLLGDMVNEAGSVMVFVAAADGRIIEVNSLATKTFGFVKKDLLCRTMDDLFVLHGEKKWRAIAGAVEKNALWQGALDAVSESGVVLPVHMTAGGPAIAEDRDPPLICFVRDISLEKEMNQMKLEATSIASHELRTPLASAKNAVDLILAGKTGAMNAKQMQFLVLAKRNIDRIVGLVDNLHDIFDIESGGLAFHFENMDIKNSIEGAVNTLKPLADQKSMALNIVIAPELPDVYADSSRIQSVILNLVGNAIYFTPDKESVDIEVRKVSYEDSIVEITVAGRGIGLPDEFVNLVFDKFYEVESFLPTEDRSGMGLGLAISRHTIEAHGGKLWRQSKQGGSNTFCFTLPVAL